MSEYIKQNFEPGQVLKADHLNYIEDGITSLSQEIAELKNEMSDAVVSTGTVVKVEADSGAKITVTGDENESVRLVQTNKNFAINEHNSGETVDAKGLTFVMNDDGSITVSGAADGGTSYFYIVNPRENPNNPVIFPAGEYTITCPFPTATNGFRVLKWNCDTQTSENLVAGLNLTTPVKSFVLDEPTLVMIGSQVTNGQSAEGTFTVQIELGSVSTDYVKPVRNMYDSAYPIIIDALDGTNVIYNENGTEITTSIPASKGMTKTEVYKLIDEKISFDPSVYTLPVLYLEGNTEGMDKDNAVTLAYKWGERTGTLTCKWQGNSSLTFPKKNYTLKFDEAFEAVEGWGEQKKYCVKANHNDFTQSRNVVSAKIWGKIVSIRTPVNETLAACPNYGAIDGFPIVIVLNGKFHGLYCFNIPKDPWMMNMGNGERECILCAELHVPQTEFRQGGAVLDGSDFELEYITNEDDISWAVESVNNLLTACGNSDGTDLDTTIAEMLDWESAIDYYIYSVLLRHVDGVSKNYLLSTYDGTKWFFTAYDMDTVFGNVWNGAQYEPPTAGGTFATMAEGNHLFDLIRTYKKDELKNRYTRLRNGVLSESNISAMFIRYAGPISRTLLDEENRAWPMTPYTSVHTIDSILNWYRLRCQYIDAEVEEM